MHQSTTQETRRSRTHVRPPAQHQSTSKRHPELHDALSSKRPSRLSGRRQSASRVLRVFLGARFLGRIQDKCSTKSSTPLSTSPNEKKAGRSVPSSLSLTVRRPGSPRRQQRQKSSTLSEPARVKENLFRERSSFGQPGKTGVHVEYDAFSRLRVLRTP